MAVIKTVRNTYGLSALGVTELPNHYIIGDYLYNKHTLLPIRDGFAGTVMAQTSCIVPMLSYNNIGVASSSWYGCNNGTIGQIVKPVTYCRDAVDTNITYVVYTNAGVVLQKFDILTKQVVWYCTLPGNHSTNPVYLSQNSQSLYFLCTGTNDTSVVILEVKKTNGVVQVKKSINLASFAGIGAATGPLFWRFLGFISTNEFIVEFVQSSNISNPVTGIGSPHSITQVSAITPLLSTRVFVNVNMLNNQATLINKYVTGVSPLTRVVDTSTLYCSPMYTFGTLFTSIDAGAVTCFMAYSTAIALGTAVASSTVFSSWFADSIQQVEFNNEKTQIMNTYSLQVYNGFSRPNICKGLFSGKYNTINNSTINTYLTPQMPFIPSYFLTGGIPPTWLPAYFNDKMSFLDISPVSGPANTYNYHGYAAGWSTYRKHYDIVKTTRTEPILRIQSMEFGYNRKTTHLAGRDLMYDCTRVSTGGSNSYAALQIAPEFVTAGVYNMRMPVLGIDCKTYGTCNNSYVCQPAGMNFWLLYGKSSSADFCYGSTATVSGSDIIFEWRRAYPDLADCPIYFNKQAMPIHVCGYAISVKESHPYQYPLSWVVEALDISTNTWIAIDTRKGQLLLDNEVDDVISSSQFNSARFYTRVRNKSATNALKATRNFFKVDDFNTKCPDGAYAIRMTVTERNYNASAPNLNISILEPETWEYEPVILSSTGYAASAANTNYVQMTATGTSVVFATTNYNGEGMNAMSTVLTGHNYYMDTPGGYIPFKASANYKVSLFCSTKIAGKGAALVYKMYPQVSDAALKCTADGFQVTLQHAHPSMTQPDKWTIDISDDGATWTTSFSVDEPELAPNAGTTNTSMLASRGKTYIFTSETPLVFKYCRLKWADGAIKVGTAHATNDNYWTITNFSPIRKRPVKPPVTSIPGSRFQADVPMSTANNIAYLGLWTKEGGAFYAYDNFIDIGSSYANTVHSCGYPTSSVPTYTTWRCGYPTDIDKNTLPIESLQYGFRPDQIPSTPMYASKYKLTAYRFVKYYTSSVTISGHWPTQWELQGSNDNTTWTTIDSRTRTATQWLEETSQSHATFVVASPDYYTQYRLVFYGSTSSDNYLTFQSIDTWIEEIKEDNPHVHTVFVSTVPNYTFTNSSLALMEGTLLSGDYVKMLKTNVNINPNSFRYSNAGKVSFVYEYATEYNLNALRIQLSPSMEYTELPTKLIVEKSTNGTDWEVVGTFNDVSWSEEPFPYICDVVMPDTLSKYFKLTFIKPTLAENTIFKENWLVGSTLSPSYYGDTSGDTIRQNLFKVNSKKWLTHTECQLKGLHANYWLEENLWLRITTNSIYTMRVNPITQNMDIIRIVQSDGSGIIAESFLDSGKNVWARGTSLGTNVTNYIMSVYPQYASTKAMVSTPSLKVPYSNTPVTIPLTVWIEDAYTGLYKTGTIRIALTGSDAKFVTNSLNTLDVVIESSQLQPTVQFKASGPALVNVKVSLIRG